MFLCTAIFTALLAGGLADVAHAEARSQSPTAPSNKRIVLDAEAWARQTQHVARLLDTRTTLRRPHTTAVTVSATSLDPSAQLVVRPGDVVQVQGAKGAWTVDRRSVAPVGIAGHVTERTLHEDWGHMRAIDTLPFGRLLVRVEGGPWLDAGSGAPLQTFVGGALQFSINDNGASFSDNEGVIRIEVTIADGPPIPSAPPAPVSTAPLTPVKPPASGCSDALCAPGQRCVLNEVHCKAAPCPAQPMCVNR